MGIGQPWEIKFINLMETFHPRGELCNLSPGPLLHTCYITGLAGEEMPTSTGSSTTTNLKTYQCEEYYGLPFDYLVTFTIVNLRIQSSKP